MTELLVFAFFAFLFFVVIIQSNRHKEIEQEKFETVYVLDPRTDEQGINHAIFVRSNPDGSLSFAFATTTELLISNQNSTFLRKDIAQYDWITEEQYKKGEDARQLKDAQDAAVKAENTRQLKDAQDAAVKAENARQLKDAQEVAAKAENARNLRDAQEKAIDAEITAIKPKPPIDVTLGQVKYIGYQPNSKNTQTVLPFYYPFVSMPKKNSVIKFSRKLGEGRIGIRGCKEPEFDVCLSQYLPKNIRRTLFNSHRRDEICPTSP